MRESDKYVFFWGGTFSNWFKSDFVIDGVTYNCAEQYMMLKKALMFGDYESAKKIMNTKDPKRQKSFGRAVSGFDRELWNEHCKKIVYDANMAKFTQNSDILKKLLDTGSKEFCEASPYDKIWGVGLISDDPDIDNKDNWKGLNWLGEVLTNVRNDIRNSASPTFEVDFTLPELNNLKELSSVEKHLMEWTKLVNKSEGVWSNIDGVKGSINS